MRFTTKTKLVALYRIIVPGTATQTHSIFNEQSNRPLPTRTKAFAWEVIAVTRRYDALLLLWCLTCWYLEFVRLSWLAQSSTTWLGASMPVITRRWHIPFFFSPSSISWTTFQPSFCFLLSSHRSTDIGYGEESYSTLSIVSVTTSDPKSTKAK